MAPLPLESHCRPQDGKAAGEGPSMAGEKTIIRTTCPRDCYDSCGIAVVQRGDHVKVLGDPNHPVSRGALCGKCAIAYNGAWRDPRQRLMQPLKRVGPKGEGEF